MLASLKSKPALAINGRIWVMNPDAVLIIDIPFKVSKVLSEFAEKLKLVDAIVECGKIRSGRDSHGSAVELQPESVTKAETVAMHD